MRKIILGVSSIILLALVLFMVNNPSDEGINKEEETITEVETAAVPDTESTKKEIEENEFDLKAKELVENQFEYFSSIVNGSYFINSRRNGPDGNYPDDWVTKNVENELQQRASEIDELLPEQSSGGSLYQGLIQTLIRINQASSQVESQKNVYNIYKTLYQLNVSLNDYELEEGMFDPDEDWSQVFGEKMDQSVKTEEELEMEGLQVENE